jgi:hypothetical protein
LDVGLYCQYFVPKNFSVVDLDSNPLLMQYNSGSKQLAISDTAVGLLITPASGGFEEQRRPANEQHILEWSSGTRE